MLSVAVNYKAKVWLVGQYTIKTTRNTTDNVNECLQCSACEESLHIYIYIYLYIYNELFYEQANLFSWARGRVKIKPESEISCHTTLTECNKWFIPH